MSGFSTTRPTREGSVAEYSGDDPRQKDGVSPRLCGLVLAAGAGSRYGSPKALARDRNGTPWVVRAVEMLRRGGCDDVVVALGAAAEQAAHLVPEGTTIVTVADWENGVAASLRAGLRHPTCRDTDAVIVTPVDTPDASPHAVRRLSDMAGLNCRAALAQATYQGAPGHPVLIGHDHLDAIARAIRGDIGARPYLISNGVREIECGDLWSGADIDTWVADRSVA